MPGTFGRSCLLVLLASACWGQQDTSQLSPRTLFYREQADTDRLPPRTEAKQAVDRPAVKPPDNKAGGAGLAGSKPEKRAKTGSVSGAKPAAGVPSVGKLAIEGAPASPPVQHLGLRYNILVFDEKTQKSEPVDPDRPFKNGECIAFEFEVNRSGYLYVLDESSDGARDLLFPSLELPNESNVVRPRTKVRIPEQDCFGIKGSAGVDRVFVVLSRNLEDVSRIEASIQDPKDSRTPAVRLPDNAPALVASQRPLGQEIADMSTSLQSRELKLMKFSKPQEPDERPNSVYVVNAANTPLDRIVTEIRIVHR
jgi:hypothetical protein